MSLKPTIRERANIVLKSIENYTSALLGFHVGRFSLDKSRRSLNVQFQAYTRLKDVRLTYSYVPYLGPLVVFGRLFDAIRDVS